MLSKVARAPREDAGGAGGTGLALRGGMRSTTILLGVTLVAAASGCGKNPYFSDDEGGPRAQGGIGGHPDELSLPYALGTRVRISVRDADRDEVASWKIVSADPAKFAIEKLTVEEGALHADCAAKAEGETKLRLLAGGGGELRAATITIRAPDRARAFAHGSLRILGRDERQLAAEVPEALRPLLLVGLGEGEEGLAGQLRALSREHARLLGGWREACAL